MGRVYLNSSVSDDKLPPGTSVALQRRPASWRRRAELGWGTALPRACSRHPDASPLTVPEAQTSASNASQLANV